jgi:hypothetical protein
MNKRLVVVSVAGSLVAAAALALLAMTVNFDRAQKRYPGSVRADSEGAGLSLRPNAMDRQAVYWTVDDMPAVKRWYAELLDLHPASDGNMLAAGNCVWMTQAKLMYVISHSISVLACSTRAGTKIVVNEKVSLWP